jgi:hypothetical protein
MASKGEGFAPVWQLVWAVTELASEFCNRHCTCWSEPNYVAEYHHPPRTGYLYATSRLSALPCLCAKRRTFPTLLLVGACAAVQAQDMTPAA